MMTPADQHINIQLMWNMRHLWSSLPIPILCNSSHRFPSPVFILLSPVKSVNCFVSTFPLRMFKSWFGASDLFGTSSSVPTRSPKKKNISRVGALLCWARSKNHWCQRLGVRVVNTKNQMVLHKYICMKLPHNGQHRLWFIAQMNQQDPAWYILYLSLNIWLRKSITDTDIQELSTALIKKQNKSEGRVWCLYSIIWHSQTSISSSSGRFREKKKRKINSMWEFSGRLYESK